MNKKFIWILFIAWVAAFSCIKDFSRQPVVSTGDFDLATAIVHGTLVDMGTRRLSFMSFTEVWVETKIESLIMLCGLFQRNYPYIYREFDMT